jgi:hypothetical protein
MDRNEALKKIPKQGFLKLTRDQSPPLTVQQKTVLIRKGNELFNKGDFEKAKKIFLTTGYTDGIIRMGDYYIRKKNVLEAFRMYKLAPAPDKVENLIMQMAGVLQHWLKEEE